MRSYQDTMEFVAKALAEKIHEGESYNGKEYKTHLEETVSVLKSYIDAEKSLPQEKIRELVCAAWLHDSIESAIKKQESSPGAEENLKSEIKLLSGTVYNLVEAVTRRKPGNSDSWWNQTVGEDGAMLVKLADRIANMKALLRDLVPSSDPALKAKGTKLIKKYGTDELPDLIKYAELASGRSPTLSPLINQMVEEIKKLGSSIK